jgi:simple sugar transport system ATP-binding protein
MMSDASIMKLKDIHKSFGNVDALKGVSISINKGECHCLLGDNGAGKSTFIKIMSGVHQPTTGQISINGKDIVINNPRDAIDSGIATVYQDLALIPLMSVSRNFWLGRELTKKVGPITVMDFEKCNSILMSEMDKIGIQLRDPNQSIGTLSGGERQTVAIARAVFFGAKILILDEPTSALGVYQTSNVLKTIEKVREKGVAVVFISHNVSHALAVGDKFTVLSRGETLGTALSGEINYEELQSMMSGHKELSELKIKK